MSEPVANDALGKFRGIQISMAQLTKITISEDKQCALSKEVYMAGKSSRSFGTSVMLPVSIPTLHSHSNLHDLQAREAAAALDFWVPGLAAVMDACGASTASSATASSS